MKLEKTDIKLAQESEIKYIIEIIKERCIWFAQNNIEQWDESYYTDLYNEKYFKKI